MRNLIFTLGILALVITKGYSQVSNLVVKGKSDFKIFVSALALQPEKFAATELQKNIREITGSTLPIVNEAKTGSKLIYVGFKGAPAALLKNLKPADFGKEEYIIRSDGKSLLIAGGGARGTLYGVIGYLSDHLGCRWYTQDVVKIPKRSSITLSKTEDRQKPDFNYREVGWREAFNVDWSIHNRLIPSRMSIPDSLGGTFLFYPARSHTFILLVPVEKYFATHPEYFSEINGVRQHKDAQLCLTNPEVVKVATATVFEWIRQNPEADVYPVSQNDGEGFCECKNCKALDEKEGSHAGTLINFINQIADSVKKVYPKVKIQTFAYSYTEIPPKTLKPADNVLIELCHYAYCSAHALESCPDHKMFIERLEKWFRISNQITVWDYYADFANYLAPFPNFETFKKDVKFYKDHNSYGLYAEGGNNIGAKGGGEFNELRAWVISQLMWNADRDAQALIDEYVSNVYGPAGQYITQYIELLHTQVKPKEVYFSIWSPLLEMNYLNQESIQKADSLFNLARKVSVTDPGLSDRIELAYLPILFSKLYFYSIGGTAFIKRNEAPELIRQFEQLVKQKEIVKINADAQFYGSLEAFINSVKKADLYFNDWWIIGPFDNKDQAGLKTIFPPEEGFDSSKSYTGKNDNKVSWKKHEETISGYIDFTKLFTPSENAVSYAYRQINLTEAKTMKFGVGSNDGVRVWINGKLVLDRSVSRRAEPNQDLVSVAMNKGENTILVKVDQLKRGWGFYFTQLK